ncbi:cytochrome c-type biogenesis protein [Marinomonas ostreistagni]|uniref:cytochrome c-type biogenesis protein n=1 Tax=Marinomonas ostreistagni TaxID=359209 RepID=UPI0019518E71|nr:cytochrome c-type biogenesis protein [Marinomonas ostreistagni]MBM6551282.1 cytochrome c-type biogenesis protein CcmH [Marinomonas ostreistagni]
MKAWLMACFVCLASGLLHAEEVVQFASPERAERYNTLIEELRCPKCQNQNLEDSNAGIAVDLRQQVYSMIQAGQSDEQIIDYMVARYGEFVLYRPVQKPSTAILWYGPFALLLVGALIFIGVTVNNRRKARKGV